MREFGLIDLLAKMVNSSQGKRVTPRQQPVIGIGDDAAVWDGEISTQLATVDSLVQDVHFPLDTVSREEFGWKALAVNLRDIATMEGLPRYALIAPALPSNTEVDDITALYAGMIKLAQRSEGEDYEN